MHQKRGSGLARKESRAGLAGKAQSAPDLRLPRSGEPGRSHANADTICPSRRKHTAQTRAPRRDAFLSQSYVRASFKHADINLNLGFFDGTPAAATVNVKGRLNNTVDTLPLSLRYQF